MLIVDPELRKFAESGDAPSRSVILEAVTNPVSAPARFKAAKEPRSKGVKASPPVDEAAQFEALGRELARLELTSEPVQLEGLRTFIVELTPEQVQRVLDLPMVAAARLNHTHRKPRDARG